MQPKRHYQIKTFRKRKHLKAARGPKQGRFYSWNRHVCFWKVVGWQFFCWGIFHWSFFALKIELCESREKSGASWTRSRLKEAGSTSTQCKRQRSQPPGPQTRKLKLSHLNRLWFQEKQGVWQLVGGGEGKEKCKTAWDTHWDSAGFHTLCGFLLSLCVSSYSGFRARDI